MTPLEELTVIKETLTYVALCLLQTEKLLGGEISRTSRTLLHQMAHRILAISPLNVYNHKRGRTAAQIRNLVENEPVRELVLKERKEK